LAVASLVPIIAVTSVCTVGVAVWFACGCIDTVRWYRAVVCTGWQRLGASCWGGCKLCGGDADECCGDECDCGDCKDDFCLHSFHLIYSMSLERFGCWVKRL
jgi:hypothetical protein